ncbi:hypothetical protein [Arabidopsis thaliana]|uniref:T4P13.20 protein n=1 Tax=Arabidopsis thaliana TaxID=3702 RepID=Q9MAC3_ARATH|nr:hypothetical protein [Arabidopsis thaliana]
MYFGKFVSCFLFDPDQKTLCRLILGLSVPYHHSTLHVLLNCKFLSFLCVNLHISDIFFVLLPNFADSWQASLGLSEFGVMLLSALLTSVGINLGLCFLFFTLYSILRKQPSNVTVYGPRLVKKDGKSQQSNEFNLERLLPTAGWVKRALEPTNDEILSNLGLDALVFIRVFVFRLIDSLSICFKFDFFFVKLQCFFVWQHKSV